MNIGFVVFCIVACIVGCCIEGAREHSAREQAAQYAAAQKAEKDAQKAQKAEESRRRADARQAVALEIAREKRRAAELALEARKLAACGSSAPDTARAARRPEKAQKAPKTVSYSGAAPVPCMLARKLEDRPEALTGEAFTVTEKLDGVRCVSVVRSGSVEMYTRGGCPIEGCVEIAPELSRLPDGMYDGELLPLRPEGVTAAANFKEAARIARRNGEKRGLVYHVFDLLPLSDWDARATSRPYAQRRAALDALPTSAHVRPLPALYRGKDADQVPALLDAQRRTGGEGIMINLDREPYHFGRCAALLKVKVKQDADLCIIGVNPGTGRNAGSLGSLTVDYKGGPVRVSSGIPAALRRAIWADPSAYVGRVVTVSYLAETQDGTGKKSLRSPVFVDLREAGKFVSYN